MVAIEKRKWFRNTCCRDTETITLNAFYFNKRANGAFTFGNGLALRLNRNFSSSFVLHFVWCINATRSGNPLNMSKLPSAIGFYSFSLLWTVTVQCRRRQRNLHVLVMVVFSSYVFVNLSQPCLVVSERGTITGNTTVP